MLKIRLKRIGRKHDPSYRIVVTEKHRGPKSGRYIEKVGFYNPRTNTRDVNSERAQYWLAQGAVPSDTVHNIFVTEKVIEGTKVNALPKKTPIKKEAPEEEKAEPKAEDPVTSNDADESESASNGTEGEEGAEESKGESETSTEANGSSE